MDSHDILHIQLFHAPPQLPLVQKFLQYLYIHILHFL